MKRKQWLAKRGHACETIRRAVAEGDATGAYYVIIHDAQGRSSEGWGRDEERAFADAHEAYRKQQRRAALSNADGLTNLRALNATDEVA